jgi:hypothetical protein
MDNLLIPKFLDTAITPIAKEAGDRLADVINLVFTPIYMVRKYKDIKINHFFEKIEKNLNKIPEQDIIKPSLNVVGPALEYFAKFGYEDDFLHNYFSNLISNAMDKNSIKYVHPAFNEIIKQLNQNDALLIDYIFGESGTHMGSSRYFIFDIYEYATQKKLIEKHFRPSKVRIKGMSTESFKFTIDNLLRLNLIQFIDSGQIGGKDIDDYEKIIRDFKEIEPFYRGLPPNKEMFDVVMERKMIVSTVIGSTFFQCVLDK